MEYQILNKYQTSLTDELVNSLPKEIQDQLFDIINNIEFVKRLISPNRKYARDLPRDEEGKIIVDITNPHILENMDYFRPTALHYQKYGNLTNLKPNSNHNSEFYKWINEEKRRCWEGYIRQSDGEWITGYMYWYLNYGPILLSKSRKGSIRADRVEDVPNVWEGIYWRFHYIEQASNLGKNCAELASRGKSKSYSLASILSHIFVIGENKIAHKNVRGVVTASTKEYLIKDGVLNKFVDNINYSAKYTQFPRKRLKSSIQDMTWTMGYVDSETGIESGTKNSIIGVTSNDDISKIRGKRAAKILIEEFGSFPKLIDLYNTLLPSVRDGSKVFGQIIMVGTAGDKESDFAGASEIMYNPDGYHMLALDNVFDKFNQGRRKFVFFFPGYVNREGCYDENGNSDVIKALIEILKDRYLVKYNSDDPNTIVRTIAEIPITPAEAIIKTGANMFPVADLTERINQIDANPREFDEVYVGNLIFGKSGEVEFMPTGAHPIREFPHKDNKIEGAVEIFQMPEKDKKSDKVYGNRYILGCLKEGEFVNTDNGLKKVEDVTLEDKLINKEGSNVDIRNIQIYNNTEPVYSVKLSSIINSTTFSAEHPIFCATPKRRYNSYSRVNVYKVPERYYEYDFNFRKVSELKVGDYVKSPILYKNECTLNTKFNTSDLWYLIGIILGDGWVESNGTVKISFNSRETELINRCIDIVAKELNRKFSKIKDRGTCYEYSFTHKEFGEFFTNNFGKYAYGKHIDNSLKSCPYNLRKNLILGYIDTDGCISNNIINIVSISKQLLCDIQDWLFSLNIVSSIKILRPSGEHIINKKLVHTKETYQLFIGTEGVNSIKLWNINGMKINKYNFTTITSHNRRDVFIKDNYIYLKVKEIVTSPYIGKVYNFECDTHTFMCNYIPTHNCDPYDDDESNTMSLGSIFVLDLWTDNIVAEYTGRPKFADEFFEICRKLCLFYNGRLNYENNKKGLFAHFSSRNSLYLLTDILDFLKDKQLMKDGYGNKSKGTNATPGINAYGRNRLRTWLLSPVTIVKNIDGNDTEVSVPKLFTVKNRALLKELINYNSEGNFDRVSAMGMLMLLREDKMILYQNNISKERDMESHRKSYENDPFFTKNYDSKFGKSLLPIELTKYNVTSK